MDCQHCGAQFTDKIEFDEHLNHHINVQAVIGRAKNRTYGARYISAKRKGNTEELRAASDNSNKKLGRPASHNAPPPLGHLGAQQRSETNSSSCSSRPGTLLVAIDGRSLPRTANWAARTPEAIRGLQKILETYPVVPYSGDGPQLDSPMTTASDVSCKHCSAIFSNRNDLNDHYLSKYCPGISAIVHLMIYDSSKVGNYRLERRLIPFDHKTTELEFQCRKCEICFETENEADEHEETHPNEDARCLHCATIFTTSHELEQHYDFHDDMEFRHRRDKLRAGEPYSDGGDRGFLEQPGVERLENPGANEERIPRKDGDLIAIGFISGEDLERVHAPRGVLKELSPYYYYIPAHLDPDHEPGSVSYHDGELCVTEGRMRRLSPEGDEDQGIPAAEGAIPNGPELTPSATSPAQKTSSIRRLFGLGKKKKAANNPDAKDVLRRSSTLTEFSPPSRQQTDLGAILHRQSSSANGRASKLTPAQSRNRSSTSKKGLKPYPLSIQGHGIPGGMFIGDRSNRTVLITGTLTAYILGCIVDFREKGKWRAKLAVLLNSANASKEQGAPAKAVNAWNEALSIFHENPELDPDGTFELVVLYEVAKCLDDLHRALDAELYFLATLKLSERKFGREHPNSFNCINCLGVLYENLGRVGDAAAMYQRSIAGRAKVLGELHWDTAMSLQELGTIHLRLNNSAAARPLLEKSLRGFENDEGPHEYFTLFVMTNLCNVYEDLGMVVELRQILDRSVPMALRKLGPEHLVTGAAVRKYVECHGKANLPQDILRLIQGYRDIHRGSGSEVARWVLEVC